MSTALQDVPYEIRLDVPLQHDEDDFIWLHPRVTAVPAAHGGEPTVLMTLQKHL